ncbi:TolC family protein [Rubinisphaera margarita]|uniref:TolC family protein n=1 Tax=Rubinisphaera margarita TaxID=2909586 RepID=UPI001EE8551F|nr:TolC family protein [Rubinisphaera margarita]MCG6158170.1 TolC family protein [Rubinisphaera margarita]
MLLQTLICGCARREVVVAFHAPPDYFSESGEALPSDRWWREFGDENLDHQVEASLSGNYSLDAALHRFQAARFVARREASDFFPDVNYFTGFDGLIQTDGPDSGEFIFGTNMAYQVDLWGEIESRVEAQRFRADATREDYDAIALALSAEVAATYFSLIQSHAEYALLQQQTLANSLALANQEYRFRIGLIRSPDVLRQRQLVDSTREQEVVALARIKVLEHRLAVLQGRPAQKAIYDVGETLPGLPPLPKTGLPAELVQRRPDVRSAFFAVQAADRDLASAITRQYPRLNLTATVVSTTESAEFLFKEWIVSLSAQLIGPLIDGGERRAEVQRNNAVVRQRLDEYEQTVVNAFREVEDALSEERYLLQRIELLESQLKNARLASEQLSKQYSVFDVDYLDLLSATQTEQRLQRENLAARLALILNRVQLYLALAGRIDPHNYLPPEACPVESPTDG